MQPGDQTDTAFRMVGIAADRENFIRRLDGRLENDLDRKIAGGVQSVDHDLRVFSDLLQGFRAVQVLAADNEPDFQFFEEFHCCCPFVACPLSWTID